MEVMVFGGRDSPGHGQEANSKRDPRSDVSVQPFFTVVPHDHIYANPYKAFEGCKSLTSINLMDTNIVHIPNRTFNECDRLESVTLPRTLSSIGNGAFRRCISLTGIAVPPTVDRIGSEAFHCCNSLATIDLEKTQVTIMEDATFADCTALTAIKLPRGLTQIKERVFFRTGLWATGLSIPSSVKDICTYAFAEAFASAGAFGRCGANKTPITLDLTNTAVTWIPAWAFQGCDSLGVIILPGRSLCIINQHAFDRMKCQPQVKAKENVRFADVKSYLSCQETFGDGLPNWKIKPPIMGAKRARRDANGRDANSLAYDEVPEAH